jgi:hypothetical protein
MPEGTFVEIATQAEGLLAMTAKVPSGHPSSHPGFLPETCGNDRI